MNKFIDSSLYTISITYSTCSLYGFTLQRTLYLSNDFGSIYVSEYSGIYRTGKPKVDETHFTTYLGMYLEWIAVLKSFYASRVDGEKTKTLDDRLELSSSQAVGKLMHLLTPILQSS